MTDAISSLRVIEADLQRQLAAVQQALAALTGTTSRRGRPAGRKNVVAAAPRKRRKMSAKARKAMSDAQKARWAKRKGAEKK